MKANRLLAACAAGTLLLATLPAAADDAAQSDKVLFENDRVRVVETHYAPGATHDTHSHPDHVVYALESSKARFTDQDGKTTDVEIPAGMARWQPAITHKVENIGTTPIRAIVFELKEQAQ
jgi:quercetin dioxygenase-like cupin family protein